MNDRERPITLEDIEDMRNHVDAEMLQNWDEFFTADAYLTKPWARAFVLSCYFHWTQGNLDAEFPMEMHKAVGALLTELFAAPNPGELFKEIRENLEEHCDPKTAKIIRCMKYFMEDEGLTHTKAVEQTMDLLGIDSYDQVKKIWQRSPESTPFKRPGDQQIIHCMEFFMTHAGFSEPQAITKTRDHLGIKEARIKRVWDR